MEQISLKVADEYNGKRLDKFLHERLNIPFSLAQKLIRTKDIKVNNTRAKSNYSLTSGDVVLVKNFIAPKKDSKPTNTFLKEELLNTIEIIFKDENILAINKPYGMPVQGGNKIKISIDDILDDLKFDYNEKPKLVHRLDRHTSGLLLIARTKQIAQELMELFQTKKIKKTYIALLNGTPKEKSGTLKMKIKKNMVGNIEKMTESDDGKESITEYKVIEYFPDDVCLVEFKPITGRMHQIRIHAAEILKCPIIGDKKYGGHKAIETYITERNKLHLAATQVMIQNLNGKRYSIDCALPSHMRNTIGQQNNT